jgi:hypothetical protein
MKITRRLKITVTQHRVLRSAPVRAFCPVCACAVETLACVQAAEVLEIDGQALAGLIAAGRVHAIALVSGDWRVCRASLFVEG